MLPLTFGLFVLFFILKIGLCMSHYPIYPLFINLPLYER